jgi:RNA polymerase sigma factor (sigma-70 family)
MEDTENSFEQILELHKGIIYKISRSYCQDLNDRKDLAQEIIIQLWRSFKNFNPEYKYSTWIYRIALNVAISFYRRESARKKIALPFTKNVLNLGDDLFSHDTENNISRLHQFIAELKDLDKALMLLYLDEKSHKEMAEILGISETYVATKINRVKIILKQKFSHIKQ